VVFPDGWYSAPAPAVQPPKVADALDIPAQSNVLPDGWFWASTLGLDGGVPARAVPPGPLLPHPELQPPISDYPLPGVFPLEDKRAPGVAEFFHLHSPPLPDYYYEPSYYNTTGIGARPLAEYGPPGYEPRETDEGQAPGTPEFTPIGPPEPVSPADRNRFVTRGIFPGSFLVPGTNTSVRFRGFVRVTGLYDFDPIGSRDVFSPNTIPVPKETGENANVSARASRIAMETWTPTPFNEWNVHTVVEADFFNGPAQAVGGGGNPFRLRFAFIDFGYFRVGQQNSVFMDGNAWPNTVEFNGPAGLVLQRRPGFRVTIPLADNLFWAIGVEQPFSDITTNGEGTNVQDVPDFASHLRYEADYGHVQLSTVIRSIGFRPTGGSVEEEPGWGASASAVFHPWAYLVGGDPVRKDNPTALERCRFLLQYTFGWGIGRYIQDTAGLGLDGQVDPQTGSFDTLYAVGWSASYEHWYAEKWLSNFTYSEDFVANQPGQAPDTYAGAKYLAASLWYIPIRNMSIGVEYLYGLREDLNGQTGRANRFNGLVQYNF
jgi:hypothetical protein